MTASDSTRLHLLCSSSNSSSSTSKRSNYSDSSLSLPKSSGSKRSKTFFS